MESKINDCSDLLKNIHEKEVVFTKQDILEEIKKIDPEEKKSKEIIEKTLKEAEFVGNDKSGEKLYTSKKYKKLEKAVLSKFKKLLTYENKNRPSSQTIQVVLKKYSFLNAEQKESITKICGSKMSVNILIGRAGSGKTTTIKAISEIYKDRGLRVIGMSLSSLASENLGKAAEIESNSIDYWIYHKWIGQSKKKLSQGDVIIVDEAGMIGTEHWKKILTATSRFKLKLIIVGDSEQFKPISAGDCFRLFLGETNYFELKQINRQKLDWMKKASIDFSELKTKSALTRYKKNGKIKAVYDVAKHAPQKYIEFEKVGNSVILCYTNDECREINDAVRDIKKKNGDLGEDLFKLNGVSFAKKDKIMFLKNNKDFNIKNGQIGLIKSFSNNILEVEINLKIKNIDILDYDKIDHAYAITLHKSQGKTFDNVIVVGNPKMDSKAFYVAMTRHSQDVELFYRKSDFKNLDDLIASASKYNFKSSLVDFTFCRDS